VLGLKGAFISLALSRCECIAVRLHVFFISATTATGHATPHHQNTTDQEATTATLSLCRSLPIMQWLVFN